MKLKITATYECDITSEMYPENMRTPEAIAEYENTHDGVFDTIIMAIEDGTAVLDVSVTQ